MEKESCRDCTGLNLTIKEPAGELLPGRYRYGCSRRKNGFINGFLSSDEKLDLLTCEKWCGKKNTEEPKKLAEEYGIVLQELFDRWNLWKQTGTLDYDVPEGIQLNRLRQRIEETMGKAEALLEEADYPECLYSPLPPLVEESYMADHEGIKARAACAIQSLKGNPDYRWLVKTVSLLNHADRSYSEAYRILCQIDSLELAIRKDDYFRMKQQGRVEELTKSLACYRAGMKLLPSEIHNRRNHAGNQQLIGQMDIFGCDLKTS